jgi:4a-hydroxytetrahydrobiopterin dehydratase
MIPETPIEGGDMSETIESSRFHEVGWRVLAYAEATHFRTGSLAEGAALAEAICEVARTASRQPDIDLRSKGVTVRLQRDESGELTEADLALAGAISSKASELGATVDFTGLQSYQVAIDALVIPDVLPFWETVLGYERFGDALIDPHSEGPTFWFQQMDAPRPQRNRIHIDVWVPHDQADERVAAAIAAGGVLVTDEYAPSWWTLADAEGNEADVCTWRSTG